MAIQKRHVSLEDQRRVFVAETIPHQQPILSPCVVLVPGMGMTAISWCAVQRLLPSSIRTFTYDRLGLGESDDPVDVPRTAVQLAQELRATLIACNIPPPYLLVAHSYASIICREFLESYDDEVAGIIYVDANQERTHLERHWPVEATRRVDNPDIPYETVCGLAEGHGCTEEEWAEIMQQKQVRKERQAKKGQPTTGEWTYYESSLIDLGKHKQLERRALGDRPLSIIVANLARDFQRSLEAGKKAGLGSDEDHALVQDFCDRLPAIELRLAIEVLQLSSLHRLTVTSVSGHLVTYWEPELCVQEIMWCLGRILK